MNKPIVMPFSDLVKLLRIPFSFFLLPVFMLALTTVSQPQWINFILLFFILHLLIYPASNVYNSYMDQDTKSIGGLKHPPRAGRETYIASLVLDAAGLAAGLFISFQVTLMLALYSVVSRLYSWRGTRIKKYPWLSWTIVSLVQGGYTFMLCNMCFSNIFGAEWFSTDNMLGFLSASLLVGGSYPLTQIYQHRQDLENGDRTISYILGITGTFVFSLGIFVLAFTTLYFFFKASGKAEAFPVLILFLMPVIHYLFRWIYRAMNDPLAASYRNSMRMSFISALMMICAFAVIAIFFKGQS